MIESLFLLSSFLSLYSPLRPSPCSSNQSMAMADEQVMLTQIAHLSVQNKEVDMMGETNYVGSSSSSSSSSKCSDSTTICGSGSGNGSGHEDGVCVICMDKTPLQETALVKGCEHAYCVICILRWATYNQNPSCPQCKLPFLFLNVHRSLDGRIHDYMFEESVCLLLRATWFVPVPLVPQEENCDDLDDIYHYAEYEDDDDDLDDIYFNRSPSLRIGNRRWGDNGYVRAGRKEARPINRESHQVPEAGSSSGSKQKEVAKEATGRRAKRALKREAADKAAAEKHIKHLQRFGRK